MRILPSIILSFYFSMSLLAQQDSGFTNKAEAKNLIVNGKKELATSKYQGDYSWGNKPEYGSGSVIIYPETDSTVLFYIDICRGLPDLNMGSLYGRLKIKNGHGIYSSTLFGKCMWQVIINNKTLVISTLNNCEDCGFGYGVFADHKYERKNRKKPKYFENGEGTKIYFNQISPENYYK